MIIKLKCRCDDDMVFHRFSKLMIDLKFIFQLCIHISWLNSTFGVNEDKCEPVERGKKCPGYGDKPHLTHCCLSKSEITPYYCCSLEEKERINADLNSTFTNNITEIIIGAGSVVLITCFLVAFCCFFCDGCLLSGNRRRKNLQINRHSNGYFLPPQSQQQRHRQQTSAQTADAISECFNVSSDDPLSTLNNVPNYQHYYPVPIFSADYKPYDAPPPYPMVVQENLLSNIDIAMRDDERVDDRVISPENASNEPPRPRSTSSPPPPTINDDDVIVNYEQQNLMNAQYSEIYTSAKDRLNESIPG